MNVVSPLIWARVLYRLGQFWRGLRATVTPEERQQVARVLPIAALPLFMEMPLDAQRHSLDVLERLWAAGRHHPDLAVAALLHDCGKVAAAQGGVQIGLWLRGPLVLAAALVPRMAHSWASPDPAHGWRYALYVQREHPAIGAAWAARAGCSPLSCWLIAQHQTPLPLVAGDDEARGLLAALQDADEGR
ncbi:MAG: hypothetical protein IT328_20855 [Caldilineaceae bacterium]|nr:hypothetical protein [Caldilineaceae bacterium]